MRRKSRRVKPACLEQASPAAIKPNDVSDVRPAYAPPHRPDWKSIIERFFRSPHFPPRASRKPPKEKPERVMSLRELSGLVEAAKRRADDQRREHRRATRKSANRK